VISERELSWLPFFSCAASPISHTVSGNHIISIAGGGGVLVISLALYSCWPFVPRIEHANVVAQPHGTAGILPICSSHGKLTTGLAVLGLNSGDWHSVPARLAAAIKATLQPQANAQQQQVMLERVCRAA